MSNLSQYWGRQLIAKKNTHFKYSTRVFVVDDYGNGNGLFRLSWAVRLSSFLSITCQPLEIV